MKRRTLVPIVLGFALAWAPVIFPQSPGEEKAIDSNTVAQADNKKIDPVRRQVQKGIDGDQAYKANCSRCHASPRKFSEREMATIMRHMRVRANLTEEETQAILQYLTR